MLKHIARVLVACATLGPSILYAGVYEYPMQGYHKACADGSTVHIAIYPGSPSARKVDAFPFRTLFTSRGGSSVSTSDYSGIRSSHLIRLRDFRTIVVRSISANTRCVYRSDCK